MASIDGASGLWVVRGRAAGHTVVTAQVAGFTVDIPVQVSTLPAQSDAVVVDSFLVASGIDGNTDAAWYAPRLWVHARQSGQSLRIVGVVFDFSGDRHATRYCAMAREVVTASSAPVFGDEDALPLRLLQRGNAPAPSAHVARLFFRAPDGTMAMAIAPASLEVAAERLAGVRGGLASSAPLQCGP
ncbi:MAG: hypothetical protein IPF47_20685 [Gemmatimonadetes bacterium]|nr:hypothetical protein [Gemmatimonadota bacterium]